MMWWNRLKKDNSEKQNELQNEIEEHGGLEKSDMPAMILSALLVILPVAIAVVLLLSLLILLPVLLA